MTKSDVTTPEKPSIKELVGKLGEIHLGLKQSLADLKQKLEILDENPDLLTILVNAKKDAESRANNLEAEVKQLREELKNVKDLLGLNMEKK